MIQHELLAESLRAAKLQWILMDAVRLPPSRRVTGQARKEDIFRRFMSHAPNLAQGIEGVVNKPYHALAPS
jgi:hypothetical protein